MASTEHNTCLVDRDVCYGSIWWTSSVMLSVLASC